MIEKMYVLLFNLSSWIIFKLFAKRLCLAYEMTSSLYFYTQIGHFVSSPIVLSLTVRGDIAWRSLKINQLTLS